MIAGIVVLTGLALIAGIGLIAVSRGLPRRDRSLVDRIERELPQTQCAQCGYIGCRPYAEAIAEGSADINRCPPGGTDTVAALASLLNRPPTPVDATLGASSLANVAVIDESRCIGCALCLPACPVDAIVGANGYLHTVIADECTGCELCVSPCPVDCIAIAPRSDAEAA